MILLLRSFANILDTLIKRLFEIDFEVRIEDVVERSGCEEDLNFVVICLRHNNIRI